MNIETVESELIKVKRAPVKRLAFLGLCAFIAIALLFAKSFFEEKGKLAANSPSKSNPVASLATPPAAVPSQPAADLVVPMLGAILLIDSDQRDDVIDDMDVHLADSLYPTKKPEPQMSDWVKQAGIIGNDKPAVVVIHLHSLRPEFKSLPIAQRYLQSEVKLLDGLGYLHANSLKTRFILWSQSVAPSGKDTAAARMQLALDTLLKDAPGRRAQLEAVLRQSALIHWPDKPVEGDYRRLRSAIDMATAAAKQAAWADPNARNCHAVENSLGCSGREPPCRSTAYAAAAVANIAGSQSRY